MEIKYKEKLKTLPEKSGVYIMLDEQDNILYVGKAKILKNRVRQYFHNSVKNEKTQKLVSKICDFRYIITESEYEALILENNLIKQHNPPYNILLKDDHTYPYIRINVKEPFPRLEVSYKLKNDGAKYFGPYMLGVSVRELIEIIQNVFPLRTCAHMPKKECLNYHLGRCLAPCTNKITKDEYSVIIQKVINFLSGDYAEVQEILNNKMLNAAQNEAFEQAAIYRDSLNNLEKISRKQTIPFKQKIDLDVFTFVTNGKDSVVNCFAVRGGKYLGGSNYRCVDNEPDQGLTSFITQYYENNPVISSEVLISHNIEFKDGLEEFLSKKANKKVIVQCPTGGIRSNLIDQGIKNAEQYLSAIIEKQEKIEDLTYGACVQLRDALNLKTIPMRIECYDISHISGTNKVSSMVVFKGGAKAANMYRHFRIKTVEGNNDFACMYETFTRRFEEYKKGKDISFSERPDLIIVDGGKGQLSYALQAEKDCDIDFQMCSLAKRIEEVFMPNQENSIILPRNSLALKLIVRIRDEAHRFAITYHRNLRTKMMTVSTLTKIEGIGKAKATKLMDKFKKIDNIQSASDQELKEILNEKDIQNLRNYFKGTEDEI